MWSQIEEYHLLLFICDSSGKESACHHAVEYKSALKRHEVLIQATTQMNLENIMLRERSQTRQATEDVVPLTRNVQTVQSTKQKDQ